MNILVTGGAGLIGSNLVSRLVDSGQNPIVVDNLWRGNIQNLYVGDRGIIDINTKFFQYDLCDIAKCLEVTKNIDVVVHLADVVAGINYVFSNELDLYRTNTLINSNVLYSSIVNKVPRYIYIGTACSYPEEKQSSLNPPPFKEEEAYPANPESSYGWSKLMGEYECGLAEKEGKIDLSILRLHNVYGPPSDLNPETSQVIPALCRKVIRYPEEEFLVWGSGKQRRGFLYVDDVVDGIMMTMKQGFGHGVIQLGPTKSHSISEVAEKVVNLAGKDIEIKYDTERPEGDKDRMADISKAREILGWYPTISLEIGLARTFQWIQSHMDANP